MILKIRMALICLVLSMLAMQPTAVNAQYCTTPYWYPCSYYNTYINSVVTSNGTTNISSTSTACSAPSGYIYYSTQTHTGPQGATVNFAVTNNPFYTLAYGIYVDFNGDGDFIDPGEQVYSSSGLGAGSTANSSFTIPATAAVGTTRMRVRCDFIGPISPCGMGYYGECEDYRFVITQACAAAITAQAKDTAVCSGSNGTFSITASNTNTYQWQLSTNGGTSWANIANTGVYSGATTNTLLITGATMAMNNYEYRCVAGNTAGSCTTTSMPRKLTVNQTPQIVTTVPGFACTNGAGQVGATATAGVTIRWWDQLTGGNLLDTGTTYNIASATGTRSYYAEPYISTLVIPGSISTSTANNGQSVATFDFKPLTNMTITSIDFTPRSTTTYTASVYFRSGTMVGNTGSSSGWTLLGTSSSFSATANVVTTIPLTLSQNVNANSTYSFYIYVTGGTLGYTNGTGTVGTLWTSNSDMEIYEGYGSSGLFASGLFTTRTFAGTIHYTKTITPPCTNTNRTAVQLTVDAPPVISTHPTGSTICNLDNVAFSVVGANVGSYQWEVSTNGGTSWTDVSNGGVYSNATTATLNLTAATSALTGNQYRCKLTSPCSIDAYSNTATLTVNPPATISVPPPNTNVCIGGNTTLSCNATGFGTLTYQWQFSSNGGTTWNTITNGGIYSNATTSTLSITGATVVIDNFEYRCIVTGTCPPAATSAVAVLSVDAPPSVTTQPSDEADCPGTTVTFSCAGTGGGLNYQWQEYITAWTNLSNTGVYSGTNTSTLSLNGIMPSMNSRAYRCVITGNCTPGTVTDSANLTVYPVPNISGTSNTPVCEGKNLTLTSTSTTSGVTYGWTGPASYTSSMQNPTILGPTLANGGDYIVTATITATGCTASDTVPVVMKVTPVITSVTNNGPVCSGYDLNLTTSSNAGSTYSWTGPNGYSSTMQNPTITNTIIQMTGYYKVESDLNGCLSDPDSVMVTIVPAPEIKAYPSPGNMICDGDTITFFGNSANTGNGPVYQWMKNGTPIQGANSLNYKDAGFSNGDVIVVRMTPGTGISCNADLFSGGIGISILPDRTPSVTVSMDPPPPVWEGLLVTFTATVTDAGKQPKFQWKLNGVNINGATGDKWSTTTLKNSDVVTCEIESGYQCSTPKSIESSALQLVMTSVSSGTINSDVALYPNPNKGVFTLKGTAMTNAVHVEVVNSVGQVMYKKDITTVAGALLQTEIELGDVADGMYMLKLTDGEGHATIRFSVIN